MNERMNERIREFFAQYEARVNSALQATAKVDAKAKVQAFSDCFIAANPGGVACGKNDEQFQSQILQGFEYYRSIGTKSMKISGLKVTDLDEFHVQVTVRWQSDYVKRDGKGERIDFDVIYLLQTIGERPKILPISRETKRELCAREA